MRGSGSAQRSDQRCAVSASCQCPSVPAGTAEQCHVPVHTSMPTHINQCLPVHINATYQ
ncbi:unnamed protein product [Staurois parvus]|uniref:Uncharacterized protein n=1 Tax=Staurois parvus TaxID=386267 RepID=A0ABN9DIH9_9NEOB|nr:unnamed protein product [Staurois parvus]